MRKIKGFIEELNQENGSIHKVKVLNKWKDDIDIQWFLSYYFDPFKVTNVSTKKLQKKVSSIPTKEIISFKELIDFVVEDCTGKDSDIAAIHYFIKQNPNDKEFIHGIIAKTIKLGITPTTINKVYGYDFIFRMHLQLAERYQNNIDFVEGKKFALTLKLDGIRCIAIKKHGKVSLLSRQGQKIQQANQIEQEIKNLPLDNFVFDGELLVSNYKKLNSKTAYKLTTKIVRKDGIKEGISLIVFDFISLKEWESKKSTKPYCERQKQFRQLIRNCQFLNSVPRFYVGEDKRKIGELLEKVKQYHQEGLMLNIFDAPYIFTRTKNLLKVKLMQDVDLKVIEVVEGQGKYKGTTGALIVDYKGNPVRVGSGLSEENRNEFWSAPSKIIGRVIQVQYFEETEDSTGKKSLRFPVFKQVREKGKKVSYF